MAPEEVLNYTRAQPFRPFRMTMNNGRTYDIRHPEMVRVTRSAVVVFYSTSDTPDVFDRWETASLVLINHITHLDTAVA